MANPPASTASSPLLPDDQIAETLLPIIQSIFTEFVPMLEGILHEVNQLLPTYPAGKPLPRTSASNDCSTPKTSCMPS